MPNSIGANGASTNNVISNPTFIAIAHKVQRAKFHVKHPSCVRRNKTEEPKILEKKMPLPCN